MTAAVAFVVVLIASALVATSPNPTAADAAPRASATAFVASPDPAMTAAKRVTFPQAGYGFSDGTKLVQMSDADLERQLDAVSLTKATWLRVPFNWAHIQPTRGAYNWNRLDVVVDRARAHGLTVLANLSYAPDWARSAGTSDTAPPRKARQFGTFAKAAAKHFRNRVSHWEVWNEPNLGSHFGGPTFHGRAPEIYTGLLKASYRGINSVTSGSTLVGGALAAGLDNEKGFTMPTFVRRMYQAGAGKFFDAIGLHPYTTPTASSWRRVYGDVTEVRQIMKRRKHGDRQIWYTEVGHTTPTGGLSQSSQAKLLVKEMRAAARRPYVGPFFLYAIRDSGTDAAKFSENFGTLLTYDFKPKRMAARLAAKSK